MREEILSWWKQAKHDLKVAEYNLNGDMLDASAFFTQQAVEKALKALYIKKFNKLIKTHDLVFFAKKLDLPQDLLGFCDEINPFYIEMRYPDVTEEKYEKDEIKRAIKNAKKVLTWIEKKI